MTLKILSPVFIFIAVSIHFATAIAQEINPHVYQCLNGGSGPSMGVRIDCTSPREVLDAMQSQIAVLVGHRVMPETEDLCAFPYKEAQNLAEKNPSSLAKKASVLLESCNKAIRTLKP